MAPKSWPGRGWTPDTRLASSPTAPPPSPSWASPGPRATTWSSSRTRPRCTTWWCARCARANRGPRSGCRRSGTTRLPIAPAPCASRAPCLPRWARPLPSSSISTSPPLEQRTAPHPPRERRCEPRLSVMPPKLSHTGHPDADQLLEDDPLALLIGMLLDQQVTMEKAFHSPYDLKERLGGRLDANEIAAMDPDELRTVFAERPALHRFPGSMADRTLELCKALVEHYDGRAERVWEAAKDGT